MVLGSISLPVETHGSSTFFKLVQVPLVDREIEQGAPFML